MFKRQTSFQNVFTIFYVIALAVYLIIGFLPADAASGSDLIISSINLSAKVVESETSDGKLEVPESAVASYSRHENKTFLFGHASLVFGKLSEVKLKDEIIYNEKNYRVISREIVPKDLISMHKILKQEEKDTIVIMTCAGEMLKNYDATHRLIITARSE